MPINHELFFIYPSPQSIIRAVFPSIQLYYFQPFVFDRLKIRYTYPFSSFPHDQTGVFQIFPVGLWVQGWVVLIQHYILLMSTAKRHLPTESFSNSLLDDSLSDLSSGRSLPLTGSSSIRTRYRQELETYRVQRQQRVRERMMRLDYVIRNAVEINQIIEKTVVRV